MATTSERLPQNAAGRFYVTAACIDCHLCYDDAPAFFRFHEELGFSIVHCQPVTPAEITLAQETLEGCPVGAIGAD